MNDTVHVRFIRRDTFGEYQTLAEQSLPVWAIPRQGEWVYLIAVDGKKYNTKVVKLVTHLIADTREYNPTFHVPIIEALVE